MQPYETHLGLATAIAVGLLIGIERERARPDGDDGKAVLGGVRTYPIFALAGALAAVLSPWILLAVVLAIGGLVAVSYADGVRRTGDHGVTTESSVIATVLLGAMATSHVIEPMSDRLLLVAMVGVLLTFVLSSKQWFHATLAKVSRADFYATVKFLIVVVIVLPLLPHRGLGPLHAIDPFDVGLMVVTIAGLSFVGYVATRWLGSRRGLLVGAAAGGLVSSTAVTLSFARRTKQAPDLAPLAAGAIGIAWAIMVVRIAVLSAIVDPALLVAMAVPLALMAVGIAIGIALVFRRGGDAAHEEIALTNPFELSSAIEVGLGFAIVLLGSKAAAAYFGDRGLYAAAGLAGTTDVDAITVSTAKLARGGLSPTTATIAILLAAGVNTVVKSAFAVVVGTGALGRRVAVIGALGIAGAAIGIALDNV